MRRSKSTYEGWTKVGKNFWQHESGCQVKKVNYHWHIIGGKNCGDRYGRLWIAMYYAAKTPAEWAS